MPIAERTALPRDASANGLPNGGWVISMKIFASIGNLSEWSESRFRGTVALLVSCAVHASLLILFALYYVGTPQPGDHLILSSSDTAGETVAFVSEAVELIPEPVLPDTLEQPVDAPSLMPQPELNVPADLARTLADSRSTLPGDVVASLLTSGPAAGGGGFAGGSPGRQTSPQQEPLPKGATFFGSYAQGRKFVFVLDSSTSMQGDRWPRACQELMYSIAKLEDGQEFLVLCFDHRTSCMLNLPRNRVEYFSNTPEVRAELQAWLSQHRLGPATHPANAMALALKLDPDAIFLLSDGELQDDTLFMLRRMNNGRSSFGQTPVHTIALMSHYGVATLRLIAGENGGTFNWIGE
jgi:hypothetical protein